MARAVDPFGAVGVKTHVVRRCLWDSSAGGLVAVSPGERSAASAIQTTSEPGVPWLGEGFVPWVRGISCGE